MFTDSELYIFFPILTVMTLTIAYLCVNLIIVVHVVINSVEFSEIGLFVGLNYWLNYLKSDFIMLALKQENIKRKNKSLFQLKRVLPMSIK